MRPTHILLFLICLFLGLSNLSAQSGFNKIYSQYSVVDRFSRQIIINDTIYLVGVAYDTTISPSPLQFWFIKLDTLGQIIQSKLYKDSLGGFLNSGYYYGGTIKTSKDYFAFPGVVFGRGVFQYVQVDKDLKVREIYEYSIGDDLAEFNQQTLELPDGGFLIVGNNQRPNFRQDGIIRRISPNGTLLWHKYYGGSLTDEAFYCVVGINDNRFVLGGSIGPDFNNSETARAGLWVVDSNGVILNTWSGPSEPDLIAIAGLLPTPDGGFVAHGRTYLGEGPWGSEVQISLLKFDASLQMEWIKHIGPNTSNYNGVYDMIPTPDGHYLFAGQRTRYGDLTQPSTDWGGWLYKFSAQGDSIWSRADNVPPGLTSTGAFIYAAAGVLSSGSIIASGEGNIDNKYVGWVVKVSPDGCLDTLFCHTVGVHDLAVEDTMAFFPNPANQQITCHFAQPCNTFNKIEIFDLAGRSQIVITLQPGVTAQQIDLSNLASSLYVLCFSEGGRIVIKQKLVILK